MNPTNSTSEYLLLFRGTDWDRNLSPDPRMKAICENDGMLFDCARMAYGGFQTIVES